MRRPADRAPVHVTGLRVSCYGLPGQSHALSWSGPWLIYPGPDDLPSPRRGL